MGSWADRVLNLDRAACGRHRRHEQGGDVVGAKDDSARRRHGSTATRDRCTATGGRAAGGSSAGAPRDPEHLGHEAQRSSGRRDRRQLPGDAAKLPAEAAAGGTVAHVPAGGGVGAHAPVV